MILNFDNLHNSNAYAFAKSTFKNEFIRKFIHVFISIMAIILYSHVSIELGSFLFVLSIIINLISEKTPLTKFLNKVNRVSFGQYFYIAGVFLIFIVSKSINTDFSEIVFYYTMLALGVADAFAVSGKYFLASKYSKEKLLRPLAIQYGKKTLFGLMVFCIITIFSAFITVIPFTNFEPLYIIKALIISIMLGLTELLGVYGVDNLLIPFFSYLYFFLIW